MVFWMLAREVKILRGELELGDRWEKVKVDLFIARDLEMIKKLQEDARREEE